ncbi:hypothetical protein HPB51_011056 [Rhipicephalus microplus]|uniref:SAP domain-containing protein n=1 Tax=Rhipicephalus microplus TaxID=6941 RepID=A0A9J6DMC1_RHIMP|nr:hypothetical protein HPB51_011056 [Rhipicephalus microplus]
MAQPTGCESTELHAKEETTSREGATPRRTSSRDSETTIVESVFTTLDHSRMANVTKKQLVDELSARGLRCSGRKDELIARIIRDNITRQALEPTDSSTKDQAAYDDDRQAHLETLSADNATLCAELSSLRAQLSCATTSERETLHEAHQNASLPTERVTTSTLGLHHSVSADITMSSGSTRPPSLNDGTNQDAARPAAPTVSTHEGEPSMAQILAALVNTQALLANMLSKGPPTTSLIQIHSTGDTVILDMLERNPAVDGPDAVKLPNEVRSKVFRTADATQYAYNLQRSTNTSPSDAAPPPGAATLSFPSENLVGRRGKMVGGAVENETGDVGGMESGGSGVQKQVPWQNGRGWSHGDRQDVHRRDERTVV